MRTLWLISALLLLALPLRAQDSTAEPTAPPTRAELEQAYGWACPQDMAGKTLNIYSWPAYFADEVIPNFETLCDVTVNYDAFGSNGELYARLRVGNAGYDLIVISNFLTAPMAEEGIIQAWDVRSLSNFGNLATRFQTPEGDSDNQYIVPYVWGSLGIAYNKTLVDGTPESWADFFTYDGPTAWFEDTRTMLGIALLLLGYDPNSTDPAELAAAEAYLIANGDNVVTFSMGNPQQLLSSGDVAMVYDNNGYLYQLLQICQCDDYGYVIPSEGSYIWTDNLAIPADAPTPALAQAFIDYLLIPAVAAQTTEYLGFPTPNQAALDGDLIDPLLLDNPIIYHDEETLSRLFYAAPISLEADLLFSESWSRIKIALAGE
jgi:spermidine/putrescine transport system substrate-binding protein